MSEIFMLVVWMIAFACSPSEWGTVSCFLMASFLTSLCLPLYLMIFYAEVVLGIKKV